MQNKQSFSYYLSCKLLQEFQDISPVLLKSGKNCYIIVKHSWSSNLQNVETCFRLQFNGYLKEEVNSGRKMDV